MVKPLHMQLYLIQRLFSVTFHFSSHSFQNGAQPSSSVRVSAGRGGGDGEERSHGRGGGELGP